MDVIYMISTKTGYPQDQVKFLTSQAILLILALLYRRLLPPATASPGCRHLVGAAVGLVFVIFMCGWYSLHMIAQVMVVFVSIKLCLTRRALIFTFVFIMAYMTWVHYIRLQMTNSYASFFISYPMMTVTQKLSIIVFGLYDGLLDGKEELTERRKKHMLKKSPSLIEFLGYTFHFAGVALGPGFFLQDYIDFIKGDNLTIPKEKSVQHRNTAENNKALMTKVERSLHWEICKKLTASVLSLILFTLLDTHYPLKLAVDLDFTQNHGIVFRHLHIAMMVFLYKLKYICWWKLAEAIQNAAGLGLRFMDGKPKWDLTCNVKVWEVIVATSYKGGMDNWNIFTAQWLRYILYERYVPYKLYVLVLVSALWHGLEFGLYVSFLGMAFYITASRKLRRHIRPYIAGTKYHWIYDIFTCLVYHFCSGFILAAFFLRDFRRSISFYTINYWSGFILLIIILLMPFPKGKPKESKKLK